MGYWDAPDGTECIEKTWITTKLGAALGFVGSAYYFVAYNPELTSVTLKGTANNTLTMASLGAIFGLATCLTAQARGVPDDPVNYFVGGCASGIFLGARTHNPMMGTTACLGLGTIAFFTKLGKREGWKLI